MEELATLVKDNLHTKHLFLSAEEIFVELLQSDREIMELQPMVSYHRMLLHRLADHFGLAHESVGEGDDRHLVVRRCEDSCIPDVLVSDVLGNPSTPSSSSSNRLLLKRSHLETESPCTSEQANGKPGTSLEEREAAYLVARDRIFSSRTSEEDSSSSSMPRTVPAAARRMIVHALGQSKQGESTSQDKSSNRRPDMPGRAATKLLSQALGIQNSNKFKS